MTVWPPHFKRAEHKAVVAQAAAEMIAGLAPGRGAVVQAGGCSGLWPLALAGYFDHVYTFEPDPANFDCLRQNIAGVANITAYDYALGDQRRRVGLTRPKEGAGLWRVDGPGEIQMVTVDQFLGDVAVDALVLDVEGSELAVWHGAERTLATDRPLLWFEHMVDQGKRTAWLTAHGYGQPVRAMKQDYYSVHQG